MSWASAPSRAFTGSSPLLRSAASFAACPIVPAPGRRWNRPSCGTAAMESSDIELTNGMIMIPITNPAASALSLLELLIPIASPKSRTIGAIVSAAK